MSKISNGYVEQLKRTVALIDRQIMLCDDEEEVLMLGTVMLSKARTILKFQLGNDAAADILMSIAKKLREETDDDY